MVKGLPGEERWLIIWKDNGEEIVKYQMSNAPLDMSLQRFAQLSGSRY